MLGSQKFTPIYIEDVLALNVPDGIYYTSPDTINCPFQEYAKVTIISQGNNHWRWVEWYNDTKIYYNFYNTDTGSKWNGWETNLEFHNVHRMLVGLNTSNNDFYITGYLNCKAYNDSNESKQITVRNNGITYGQINAQGEWQELWYSAPLTTEYKTIYMGDLPGETLFFPQANFAKSGYVPIGIIYASTIGGDSYTQAVMLDWKISNDGSLWSRGYVFENKTAKNITVEFVILYKKV